MNSPFALLSLVVAIPFLGVLFVLMSKDDELTRGRNAFNVCVFSIIANIVMIFRIFMLIDEKKDTLQLLEKFNWLDVPNVNILFGVDIFALLIILAVHLAVLIGVVGVRRNNDKQKSLMALTLLFLSMLTGFFVAADIFSFYIFFEAMLLPLFMIIGMFGEVKKRGTIYRFFLYNFLGAIILFSATMVIYHYYGSLTLGQLNKVRFSSPMSYYVWGAVFVAFLSRLPIWPFHYWISSISAGIRNPLTFIITALMPLTAIYGFIRFLPGNFVMPVDVYILWVNIISIITILFIALIGFINKDYQYKLFSFMTVYYIVYLMGIFMNDRLIWSNIGYSLFSFVLIVAALEVLSGYIFHKEEAYGISGTGFLCKVPHLSFAYSYITLTAVGIPLSAVFLNNFLILSKLLSSNIKVGGVLIVSLILVSASLLQELYRHKLSNVNCPIEREDDISKSLFAFMLFIMFVLLMSLFKPLWFVMDAA